ncbi:MAG: sigma-54 dependent transcriptional regulator [Aquificaceae bacterium]|nr:sigma-54 dependent transcriptional regulator [Aquificaceae bacterium]
MSVDLGCYEFFYRSISLMDYIKSMAFKKSSVDFYLKKCLMVVYEYMGYDELIIFKNDYKERDYYQAVLHVQEGKIKDSSFTINIKKYRSVTSFKGVQIINREDRIYKYFLASGVISESQKTKLFLKYFHINKEQTYIFLLHSYSKFVEIPINLDKMILDSVFTLMESFLRTYTNLQNEINTYKEENSRILSLAKSLYKEDLANYNEAFLKKVADTDVGILIEGETGTGKSTLAYKIHSLSRRKNAPFVVIDCSNIPKELFEVELFGYEKGAFTGATSRKKGKLELADGGTILFDEIGDIPADFQVKLLRLIQDKKFSRVGGLEEIDLNARFIFATNRNLEELIKMDKFRQDLFFRISVFRIKLPPFRARSSTEKNKLINSIIEKLSKKYSKSLKLDKEAINIIEKYSWPGNIRELENVLEYAAVMSEDGLIKEENLPTWLIERLESKPSNSYYVAPNATQAAILKANSYSDIVKIEIDTIINALMEAKFNITKAAAKLGVSRRQLEYRIKKYKIMDKLKEITLKESATKLSPGDFF